METTPLLEIENLSISFKTKRGYLKAVNDASLVIHEHESVALIGESGCGKTTLSTAIVDILPLGARVTEGEILYKQSDGNTVDLLTLKKKKFRTLLWSQIAMMFQASQSSFNPVKKVRMDFIDAAKAHHPRMTEKEILKKSEKLLTLVMLDAERVLNAYPHELSGGMKQRALLALALLLEPKLVILDEPTTALDLLTQEKVVALLNELKEEFSFSYLFVTHDLSIVSELADRVVTMYAGRIIETAPVASFFQQPKHPYSRGLIDAMPKLALEQGELVSIPGTPPDLIEQTSGCPFAPRCHRKSSLCTEQMPPMTTSQDSQHEYACWHPYLGV
ncbi:peptide ABC transporter ATP-binding protein [Chryseomicrobium excrementi]|uniref:Peptide ABC transporter ATP-binding protein n=1 Tax=Chryseomicrobium excrementi TaxID=2041346 RepID=A0A2M9F0F9_9BACL|nr:ABC transporter ATP-binding protein [Chryseomicrobium excrementi]PJK16944.1 peptide ABC transporter ATP-binding protein [Chryseomicrobium excrementi]